VFEGVLKAVNLGDDADTTGAICGQLAGAYYGLDGVPDRLKDKIAMKELISSYAEGLYDKKKEKKYMLKNKSIDYIRT
jgi:ADP-ribosyl-[dinitrogen reductase] hydrolase